MIYGPAVCHGTFEFPFHSSLTSSFLADPRDPHDRPCTPPPPDGLPPARNWCLRVSEGWSAAVACASQPDHRQGRVEAQPGERICYFRWVLESFAVEAVGGLRNTWHSKTIFVTCPCLVSRLVTYFMTHNLSGRRADGAWISSRGTCNTLNPKPYNTTP